MKTTQARPLEWWRGRERQTRPTIKQSAAPLSVIGIGSGVFRLSLPVCAFHPVNPCRSFQSQLAVTRRTPFGLGLVWCCVALVLLSATWPQLRKIWSWGELLVPFASLVNSPDGREGGAGGFSPTATLPHRAFEFSLPAPDFLRDLSAGVFTLSLCSPPHHL